MIKTQIKWVKISLFIILSFVALVVGVVFVLYFQLNGIERHALARAKKIVVYLDDQYARNGKLPEVKKHSNG